MNIKEANLNLLKKHQKLISESNKIKSKILNDFLKDLGLSIKYLNEYRIKDFKNILDERMVKYSFVNLEKNGFQIELDNFILKFQSDSFLNFIEIKDFFDIEEIFPKYSKTIKKELKKNLEA